MDRSQIRWRNVGRLAAGAAGAGALLVVAPGLLDPPDPPPLPADVGLATGATGFVGVAREPEPIRPDAEPDQRQTNHDDRPGKREREVRRRAPTSLSHDRHGARSDGRPRPPAARPPATAPAAAVPWVPPPAIGAPAPPSGPPPAPIPSQPGSAGPSEFGFER